VTLLLINMKYYTGVRPRLGRAKRPAHVVKTEQQEIKEERVQEERPGTKPVAP